MLSNIKLFLEGYINEHFLPKQKLTPPFRMRYIPLRILFSSKH
jgi:hypothetical protein